MANSAFCEKTKWMHVQQPMNTISGLAFLGTAYMLKDVDECFHLTWMLIILSIATTFMHATGSNFWGKCDMASMFLCVTYSLLKNNGISESTCLFLSVLSFLMCFLSAEWVHLNTFISLATLWILSYIPLLCYEVLIGYIVFLFSLIVWIKDRDNSWCSPHSLMQGHSVWHIGSAVGFYFLLKQTPKN